MHRDLPSTEGMFFYPVKKKNDIASKRGERREDGKMERVWELKFNAQSKSGDLSAHMPKPTPHHKPTKHHH